MNSRSNERGITKTSFPKESEDIRKAKLRISLRLASAQTNLEVATEDQRLYSKMGGRKNGHKAMKAKIAKECYAIYIRNLRRIDGQFNERIEYALRGYNQTYRKIWLMYFIERNNVETIANAVSMTATRIKHILVLFRKELREGEEEGD